MESIDRLRAWWRVRFPIMDARLGREFREHVDDIEREVKANRVDAYTEGYDEGFASADDWVAQHEDAMAEHGWVRLPLDADGVPIRIGDVMEWPDCSTAEVVGIGDGTFFYVEDGEDAADWSCASDKIHHHAPTVEDVLREFAKRWDDPAHYAKGELVEAFAAKLRLAGDE